jgi:hypothetical protein
MLSKTKNDQVAQDQKLITVPEETKDTVEMRSVALDSTIFIEHAREISPGKVIASSSDRPLQASYDAKAQEPAIEQKVSGSDKLDKAI